MNRSDLGLDPLDSLPGLDEVEDILDITAEDVERTRQAMQRRFGQAGGEA